MRRAENAATVHLECPVCRALIKVANGNVAAFAAAHAAHNFLGPAVTPRTKPRDDPTSLNSLTVPELKLLVASLSLQAHVSGSLERDDIERAIEGALPPQSSAAADATPIARLTVRQLGL